MANLTSRPIPDTSACARKHSAHIGAARLCRGVSARARPNRGLGSTMAMLVEAGFEVTGCRQDHAEIEAAFLALAADGGP